MSEKATKTLSGYLMLAVGIAAVAAAAVMVYLADSSGTTALRILYAGLSVIATLILVGVFIANTDDAKVMMQLSIVAVAIAAGMVYLGYSNSSTALGILAAVLFVISMLIFVGLFIVNPNDAKVMVLFGSYAGTVRQSGFFWANPFLVKRKISLRARNLSGQKLKVNDKVGNPIEIAAVVVWQVDETFKATFEVDNYEQYVVIQSEAAVRHLAQSYPYDSYEDAGHEGMTLRASTDQMSKVLEAELQERLSRAGVKIMEARLSHLAYAPEIAEAMLRRQQASAVVAARTQIVHGAVSMVEMALSQLSERHLVELDEERRAAMISNLLVVLCSESAASPVINAGTLYQ
jgi:regulator of protease activity HflC (stomatin/prohibitin superfamily)